MKHTKSSLTCYTNQGAKGSTVSFTLSVAQTGSFGLYFSEYSIYY
ncbi:hypothetical protein [Bacillus cereus group sp. IBL03679]